jgi:amino acid transporter
MATQLAERPAGTGSRSLTGTLGPVAIVFMVVAAAAPLTVVGGGAPVGIMLGNGAGFPSTFLLAAAVLLLFSVGLSAMSRHVPRAGAFFTYIGHGLSRSWGVAAAFLALVTYTAIQVSVYGFIGAQLQIVAGHIGLAAVPWWVWSLAVAAVTGVLGYRHIDLSSKVLGVLLIGEIGVVLALVVAVVASGGAEGLSLEPFTPTAALSGAPGVALMFAVAGFIGFESTAVFRDEARRPERTIPRATYAAITFIGLFYALASWGLVMAWGPSTVVAAAAADPGGMMVAATQTYLGTPGAVAVQTLLITSLFACVLSFHNVLARYVHALGSTSVLPALMGRSHSRHGSPHIGSLAQTATTVLLVTVFAIAGLDPIAQVFTWMSGLATLGVLILMALTCLAVIVYFARTGADTRWWQTRLAPGLGLAGLVVFTAVVVSNFPMLIGGSSRLAAALAGVLVLAVLVGLGVGTGLRLRRPETYARITEAIAA